jgi:HD-GYP domain-containing protein (c-di-GMP phosphodiesterase class II)
MRLLRVSTHLSGSVLGRDILSGRSDALPLLRAGVKLTPALIDRLLLAGVRAVYIEDQLSHGVIPAPLVSDSTRAHATRVVAGAYKSAQEALLREQPLQAETVALLESVVARLLSEVGNSDLASLVLDDMATADAYTFQHSIDVTALGLLLGHELFFRQGWRDYRGRQRNGGVEDRLFRLGLGLLLHDVGKLTVPLAILHKPGRLTSEEYQLVRRHPRAGFDLLSSGEFCPLVRAVVLRHHERWDGNGYPDGQRGQQIHEMARIAAVADVYDAITSARPYAPARPPHEAVRVVLEGAGSAFDPAIVELFARLIPPFPAGAEIRLDDGRRALVVSSPPELRDRPLVRILGGSSDGEEIPLAEHPEMGIQGWPQRGRGRRSPAHKRAPAQESWEQLI